MKTSRMSDAAVLKRTGKTWAEWFKILDKAGARRSSHPKMALYLHKHQKVPGWWAQMITVAYEQVRGLRKLHESSRGFQISSSKTMPVALAAAFRAWTDAGTRNRWLKTPIVIRKANPGKNIRLGHRDTLVEVRFYSKGPEKTQVVVDHTKLPDAKAAEKMKAHWARALERLAML